MHAFWEISDDIEKAQQQVFNFFLIQFVIASHKRSTSHCTCWISPTLSQTQTSGVDSDYHLNTTTYDGHYRLRLLSTKTTIMTSTLYSITDHGDFWLEYCTNRLVVPTYRLNSCGIRAFSVLTLRLWNSLPRLLRDTGHNNPLRDFGNYALCCVQNKNTHSHFLSYLMCDV